MLALALTWGLPQVRAADQQVILDVRGYAQEGNEWCWAATGQAVMEFLAPDLGHELCQCRQAEGRTAGLTCCAAATSCTPAEPLSPQCRDVGWPQLGRLGFEFRTTCDPLPETEWDRCVGQPLGWDTLVGELSAGRPVLRAYRPKSSPEASGHTVIVLGYRQRRSIQSLLIFDPKRVCRASCESADVPCCQGDAWWLPLDKANGPPGYSHWVDIFGIRKKGDESKR